MNKMILNVIGNGVWDQYNAVTQNVLSDVIAKYAVVHVNKETCMRVKLVCKSWCKSLNVNDPNVKISPFAFICTPMCERFVEALVEIDTTTQALKSTWTKFHQVPTTQEDYEKIMLGRAVRHAMFGYKSQADLSLSYLIWGCSKIDSLMKSPGDKAALLAGAGVLFEYFYPERPVTKCFNIVSEMSEVKRENHLEAWTVGQLLMQIEDIKENDDCIRLFLKVIDDHKLLPIEPAVLQAYKEPEHGILEDFFSVLKAISFAIGIPYVMLFVVPFVILSILRKFGF